MRKHCVPGTGVLRRSLVCALLMMPGLVSPAFAQYFGRNKVQYRSFCFEVLKTQHFDIYFYQEEREAAEQAARLAERWYARLSSVLSHELKDRQPILLYASHPDFEQTNAVSGMIDEGTGGVTEAFKRRVILPLAATLAETDHVLGHELVHAFQYDLAARQDVQGRPVGPGIMALPLWFIEGMAEYLSLGPIDAHTAMWIRDATAREKAVSAPSAYSGGKWTAAIRTRGPGAACSFFKASSTESWNRRTSRST